MLSTSALLSIALAVGGVSGQALYGQCGGQGWTGGSSCPSGSSCSYQNPYYSQCLPGGGNSSPSGTASPPVSSAAQSASGAPSSSSIASNPATPDSPGSTLQTSVKPGPTNSAGGLKVKYAGVNIAGCDFGCDTSGNCNTGSAQCPSSVGPTQMQHFVKDDGLNAFRLPVGWQSLVNNQLGGTLDPTFLKTYDNIVQSCLSTGASCIVDIHNYARWNGGIIGQGGPSDDQFVSLWKQLATKYKASSKVIFGVMNEPHDLDMSVWAQTVQKVVTAIRQAGASSQVILLPGTGYTSAGAFPSQSGPALAGVKNPDGTTSNLVFDVHQYYDSDHSGTNTECSTDAISDSWSPLANYLRQNKRQALVSETGGGNTASCEQKVCAALSFIAQNSDVYLGWTGWAAGSFASSYELSEVPNGSQDTPLVTQCIVGKAK